MLVPLDLSLAVKRDSYNLNYTYRQIISLSGLARNINCEMRMMQRGFIIISQLPVV